MNIVHQQENGVIIEESPASCVTDGNNRKELLINLVREERCIWDIKSPYYKDTGMKRAASEKIKHLFGGSCTGEYNKNFVIFTSSLSTFLECSSMRIRNIFAKLLKEMSVI